MDIILSTSVLASCSFDWCMDNVLRARCGISPLLNTPNLASPALHSCLFIPIIMQSGELIRSSFKNSSIRSFTFHWNAFFGTKAHTLSLELLDFALV